MKSHLIQLSLDFDEDAIRRQLESNVAKQVEKAMFGDNGYTHYSYHGVTMSSSMKDLCEKEINKFCELHKDEIIEAAGKHLADKLSRTKKGKALLGEDQ